MRGLSDGEAVLGKIRGFELSSWNFIGHDPKEFRHYGPMAQDFFAAFGHDGIGQIGSETTINSGDLAGILMIAVQALEKRTAEIKQKEAQIAVLASKVEELTAKYAYLDTVAARLEGMTNPPNVLVRADRVIKAERLNQPLSRLNSGIGDSHQPSAPRYTAILNGVSVSCPGFHGLNLSTNAGRVVVHRYLVRQRLVQPPAIIEPHRRTGDCRVEITQKQNSTNC